MEWKVAPSYANWKIAFVDEDNHKAHIVNSCWKCGGSGSYAWFGTCYACDGTGKNSKIVKAYTPEEYEKYVRQTEKAKEKRVAAAAEKRERLQAESDINLAAALEENGFDSSNPLVYLVGGGNTFTIKDWLKEHGFKFNPNLLWYTSHETKVPEGYQLVTVPFLDVFNWNCMVKKFFVKEEAKEIAAAALRSVAPKSNSEWVGEEKERLRDLKVTLTNCRECETAYGLMFIYTFKLGDNVLTWFTSSCKDVEVGSHILLTGTVKEHLEYNGEKQTKLSRCILKEGW